MKPTEYTCSCDLQVRALCTTKDLGDCHDLRELVLGKQAANLTPILPYIFNATLHCHSWANN